MQDRPTAVELLDALATYLEEEVGPELEGPLVYRTRVAMNLLSVVRRGLRGAAALPRAAVRWAPPHVAPAAEGWPRVALETLNARLARRLRRGGDSAFDEAAWPVLMVGAREKLAVLRPGYDRYDSAGERPGGAS